MQSRQLLSEIQSFPSSRKVKIMNVCGGHERTISQSGLRSLLPEWLELIPGPGCPVCVCPEDDIQQAIALSLQPDIHVASFGDMLRVPITAISKIPGSLLQARAQGGQIHPIASPQEAIALAHKLAPDKVVFFAAGFETTMAPVSAMFTANLPDNLFFLISGRRTAPIVKYLLRTQTTQFDALIAPGHVATIMGANEWQFIGDEHQLPCAVAGFETNSFLAAALDLLQQIQHGTYQLKNHYRGIASNNGNQRAQEALHSAFDVYDATWRGIGTIPASGYKLATHFASRDAAQLMPNISTSNTMPKGCDCTDVVLGKIYPDQCKLYGKACNPQQPKGPCMVSDEGACQLWWNAGIRQPTRVTP